MNLSVTLQQRHPGFELNVAFEAPPGVTVLFGPSGAGKTTIAHAVAGLIRPDDGRIALGQKVLVDRQAGRWVPPHRRRIGYVFQDARLFPHLTIRQNLRFGGRFAPRGTDIAAMDDIVAMLGIGTLLDRRPGALSGGERQRVALGRALLSGPRMLIADEPLAALDAGRKASILPYFETLRDHLSIPILYVTHSPAEVARLATTVIALRAGRIVRIGNAAEVLADPTLAGPPDQLGAVFSARIIAHHVDGVTEVSAGGVSLFLPRLNRPTNTNVTLRIPAQDVILSKTRPQGLSALNILVGRVAQITNTGDEVIVTLATEAGPIPARLTRRSATALNLVTGQTCHAIVKSMAIVPD